MLDTNLARTSAYGNLAAEKSKRSNNLDKASNVSNIEKPLKHRLVSSIRSDHFSHRNLILELERKFKFCLVNEG